MKKIYRRIVSMCTKYCTKCGYPMRRVKDEKNNKIITICSNTRCNHMYARKITKRGVYGRG